MPDNVGGHPALLQHQATSPHVLTFVHFILFFPYPFFFFLSFLLLSLPSFFPRPLRLLLLLQRALAGLCMRIQMAKNAFATLLQRPTSIVTVRLTAMGKSTATLTGSTPRVVRIRRIFLSTRPQLFAAPALLASLDPAFAHLIAATVLHPGGHITPRSCASADGTSCNQ